MANQPNIAADLIRIHSIITRGLDVSIEHAQSFARDGDFDAPTQEGFIIYVRSLLSVLHAHHLTEDEMAFPYFRDVLPGAPFDALMAQHAEMESLLDECGELIERVAADAGAGEALRDLSGVLAQIRERWQPHIQIEEQHLSPERAADLGVEEQIRLAKQFAKHTQEHSGPDYLVVPFMLHNLPPEDRAIFSRGMPPVVTEQLVPVAWKEKWEPMKPFLLD